MTEAHACEQLAEDRYLKVEWPTVKSFESQVQCPKHYTTRPHNDNTSWILIVKNPRTFHKSGMRGAHYTIGSGVLLKMEVGIRKGAWQRAWRYPAYLWPLRWVYVVKKNQEVGIRPIPAYRRGQDSPWKSQSEWQRTGINGESTSMVWPTLGSRTAKEQEPAYTPQYTTDHRQRQRQVDTINTEC